MIHKLMQERIWLMTDMINMANIDLKLTEDKNQQVQIGIEILKYTAERDVLELYKDEVVSLSNPFFFAIPKLILRKLVDGYQSQLSTGDSEFIIPLLRTCTELRTVLWIEEALKAQTGL